MVERVVDLILDWEGDPAREMQRELELSEKLRKRKVRWETEIPWKIVEDGKGKREKG